MNIAIEAKPSCISIHIDGTTILVPRDGGHSVALTQSSSATLANCEVGERFTPALNGEAVMDHHTGLMWWNDESEKLDWDKADLFCKSVTIGEFSDWFMPSDEQMLTIVDRKLHNPCLPNIFKTSGEYVWTSTQTAWSLDEAGSSRSFWLVGLSYGGLSSYDADDRARVRPVRRAVPAGQ